MFFSVFFIIRNHNNFLILRINRTLHIIKIVRVKLRSYSFSFLPGKPGQSIMQISIAWRWHANISIFITRRLILHPGLIVFDCWSQLGQGLHGFILSHSSWMYVPNPFTLSLLTDTGVGRCETIKCEISFEDHRRYPIHDEVARHCCIYNSIRNNSFTVPPIYECNFILYC